MNRNPDLEPDLLEAHRAPGGPKPRILLVDDDELLLRSFTRVLRESFEVVTATSGDQALQLPMRSEPVAVVVADMDMPGMDGIRFLDQWRFLSPATTRVMLTGQADLATAMDAVNEGQVFRFLTKPIRGEDLRLIIQDAANQYDLVTAERNLLEQTLTGSVQMLVELLSLYDPGGFGRAHEMRELALALADRFSLDVGWDLGLAAMLSRIGWLAVPAEVQAKIKRGERISPEEQAMTFRTPEVASRLIANIPRLQPVARILQYSARNFDGSGYPGGDLAGADLPLGSRILKVVQDYLDRLRFRKSRLVVFHEIEMGAGRKYDPEVVKALGEVLCISSVEVERGRDQLALKDLRPGMILAGDLVDHFRGEILLPAGTRLNLLHLEKLRNHAIQGGLAQPVSIRRTA